jgi:hypothetical protein
MRAETIKKNGKITNIYEKDIYSSKKNALIWFYEAAHKMKLTEMMYVIDNTESLFDEVVRFSEGEFADTLDFASKVLELGGFLVKVRGNFHNVPVVFEVHLNLKNIYLTCSKDDKDTLLILEELLEL